MHLNYGTRTRHGPSWHPWRLPRRRTKRAIWRAFFSNSWAWAPDRQIAADPDAIRMPWVDCWTGHEGHEAWPSPTKVPGKRLKQNMFRLCSEAKIKKKHCVTRPRWPSTAAEWSWMMMMERIPQVDMLSHSLRFSKITMNPALYWCVWTC